ncbi:hypothetical protein JTB14_031972 [Gonioctena quinquepunctata]|nr:hypothetical protein JTB14_031972 [Gonioctena quinquepunctata]
MNRTLLIVIAIIGLCTAQLTFTTDWKKRSPAHDMEENDGMTSGNHCKDNMDAIKLVYQILRSEASRLVECSKASG